MLIIVLILAAGVQFTAALVTGHCLFGGRRNMRRCLILPALFLCVIVISQTAWALLQPGLDVEDWLLLYATLPWPLILPPLLAVISPHPRR